MEGLLDDLTGAVTRAQLAPALAALEGRRAATGEHYALAVLDVDHLKALNDVYGHVTGDAALRAVAQRTLKVLRGHDQLFRYGGDEFVVVLPNTDRAGAEAILRRVHDQVTANPVEAAVWVSINLSIGVAATDEDDGRDLFERADERVRLAKRGGRNVVVAHDHAEARRAGPLSETRLVGRDEQLAAVTAFLAGRAPGVMRVAAKPGAGVTRFLHEVEVRARQAGRVVRCLAPERARRGLHLWALAAAYEGELDAEPGEQDMRLLMRNDAEAHGLVLLLTDGRWLDPASAGLVGERLKRGGVKVVEVVLEGATGAFEPCEELCLTPLSEDEVAAWLSAALGGPLARPVAAGLAEHGAGLPGRVARLAARLVEDGVLGRHAGEWRAEPSAVERALAGLAEAPLCRPVGLPEWETPLVGRAAWLHGAVAAARRHALLVLVGAGGSGKSRLAAQLALELTATDDVATDGTYWVDLGAAGSPAALPGMIAEALGLEGVDDVDALVERIAGRRLRLVLDDADRVAEQAGVLTRLLEQTPGVRLLVTARMPLRVAGEHALAVPALAPAAARELFRQGMRRVGAREEVDEAQLDALLARVGLEPLVVELAAAWTRILTPDELAVQLDLRPELLVEVPGTQPRMARFIDLARELMSPLEQEVLGTLALVRGGFTAEVARAAAGASSFFLLALLERSLLRREGERFMVHEAVAERFRSGLNERQAAEARVAHAFSELAAGVNALPGPHRTEHGYRRVDAERANLTWALSWLADAGDAAAVWPLANLLRGYFDVRGRARQGLELFSLVDAALARNPDTELRAWVRESVALFHWQRGDVAAARARVAEALELLEGLEPTATYGMALNTAAIVVHQDDAARASRLFEASARVRAGLGDKMGEAQSRGNMALMLASLSRHEEAFAALREARSNYAEVQHASGLALSLIGMAEVGRAGGLISAGRALEYLEEAMALSERIGFAHGAQRGAEECAEIFAQQDRHEKAAAAYERAAGWARVADQAQRERELLALAAREARLHALQEGGLDNELAEIGPVVKA